MEELERRRIRKNDWEKTGMAVGEFNLIHYSNRVAKSHDLKRAVCSGAHLLAIVENIVDPYWWNGFEKPRRITANFSGYVYNRNVIVPYRNDESLIFRVKGKDVAKFTEKEFSDEKPLKDLKFEVNKETRMMITLEKLMTFYEGLRCERQKPYFTFVIGSMINAFLAEGQGTVLRSIELDLYKHPQEGRIDTYLGIEQKEREMRGVPMVFYTISARSEQDGEVLAAGIGKGFRVLKKEVGEVRVASQQLI